jgi:alkanesulfonate monooxygenase SsuD/methylene tetrahydromethanopterin reductase-like flavin-dependent oxidoreductase (luciferase family)
MAASLDVLSGGRFELGLGAGGFWDAIEAYGGPRRTPGEALAALDEAIRVIRMIWSGERNLRFTGAHYRLAGAQSGPVPAHEIGIWLGVYGPKALALTGRVADGWVPSLRGGPEGITQLRDMTMRLDDAAAAAGRQPGDIRRVLNVNGAVTDGATVGLLRGPTAQWVDELTPLAVDLGFDTFVFWGDASNQDGPDQLALFAEEVVPAVRDAVAATRR